MVDHYRTRVSNRSPTYRMNTKSLREQGQICPCLFLNKHCFAFELTALSYPSVNYVSLEIKFYEDEDTLFRDTKRSISY
jgi:hypothetical protein